MNVSSTWVERAEAFAERLTRERLLIAALVAYACARCIAVLASNYALKFAWDGYGPMDWVWVKGNPVAAAVDWRNGVEDFGRSLVMHVYPLAHDFLGVEPEDFAPLMIAFEVVALALALVLLARTLVPGLAPLPLGLLVLLFALGNARNVNVAGFAQPAFIGQYYVALDLCRILAFVALLRGSLLWSAVWAALAVTIHPALGAMAAIILFAMFWANRRASSLRHVAVAGLVFVVIAGGWLSFAMRGAGLASGGIPAQRWHELAELMSFHWYPASLGVYTTQHARRLLPFLTFLLLLLCYFRKPRELSIGERQVLAGIGAALVLCVTGCVLSAAHASPGLLKVALHRANDVILLLGAPFVVKGLCDELDQGSWTRRFAATAVLLAPVLDSGHAGWPLLFAGWLAGPTVVRGTRAGATAFERTAVVLSVGIAALVAGNAIAAGTLPWRSLAYTGIEGLLVARTPLVAVLLALLAAVVVAPRVRELRSFVLLVATVQLCVLAVQKRARIEEPTLAPAYADVQTWARRHSEVDALFMVDPGHCYGFRDYSRRASFGCVMEWLHKSWVYNTDARMFQEGMRRFDELGLPLNPYLKRRDRKVGYRQLLRDVHKRYEAFDDRDRARLARAYGIDYFVLQKRPQRRPKSALRVAYENDRYVVLAAHAEQAR